MIKIRLGVFAVALVSSLLAMGQGHNFRIRTITAGVSMSSLTDTITIRNAITFLKKARAEYVSKGYEVQTIRIATQHLYQYLRASSYQEAAPHLIRIDRIARREGVSVSIGELLPPDQDKPGIAQWVVELISATENINFSVRISSSSGGIYSKAIKTAAEIAVAISKNSVGGEGNFRFTASANCPAGIPFFPAAFHEGKKSFAVGLESPNVLTEVFTTSNWNTAKDNLKRSLEAKLKPIEAIAVNISKSEAWIYNGIDTSPAPGLDASIGEAIEALTKQPFGGPSTLRACALITDVLKNLNVKTCGYSGLMLPVIEDKVLAKRAKENRFTVQELLLFSSVSGTGLDVVPIPGDTSPEVLERIYHDVAALSMKYTNKALSARLFLIPGKKAGDLVEFNNPYLTPATVMRVE
jgi:uncharacterized protein (UPF0210 family)